MTILLIFVVLAVVIFFFRAVVSSKNKTTTEVETPQQSQLDPRLVPYLEKARHFDTCLQQAFLQTGLYLEADHYVAERGQVLNVGIRHVPKLVHWNVVDANPENNEGGNIIVAFSTEHMRDNKKFQHGVPPTFLTAKVHTLSTALGLKLEASTVHDYENKRVLAIFKWVEHAQTASTAIKAVEPPVHDDQAVQRVWTAIQKALRELGLATVSGQKRNGDGTYQNVAEAGIRFVSAQYDEQKNFLQITFATTGKFSSATLTRQDVKLKILELTRTHGVEIDAERRVITLQLKELKAPETVSWKQIVSNTSGFTVALGVNERGETIYLDLASTDSFSLLMAGQAGSGKSVALNSLVCNLAVNNDPANLKIVMCDPKKVELTEYKTLPHLLHPVIKDAVQIANVIKELCSEMDRRYTLFEKFGGRKLEEYNERVAPSDKLPRIALFVDEFADVVSTAGEDGAKELFGATQRLLQLGRAAGFTVVLCTQRPTTKIIPGEIKTNCAARIAFKLPASVDSITILDEGGAETLKGRGDGLLKGPNGLQHFRGAYLEESDVKKIVGDLVKKYGEPTFGVMTSTPPTTTPATTSQNVSDASNAIPAASQQQVATAPQNGLPADLVVALDILYAEGKISKRRLLEAGVSERRAKELSALLLGQKITKREGNDTVPAVPREVAERLLAIP